MPQTPIGYNAITPGGALAPVQLDASGNLLIGAGSAVSFNVAAKTVIKVGAGRCVYLNYLVASTAGTPGAWDAATTGATAVGNQIGAAPAVNAIGAQIRIDAPFANGLVVDPGTNGVVAVVFD